MNIQQHLFPDIHQRLVDRFLAVCQADERVIAAFLGGSYARGTADAILMSIFI